MPCLKSHGCQPNCIFGALCMFRLLLAPFFTDPTVNGVNYLDMLQTYAIPAISDIPCLVFQQDRAPPHWSRHVRAYLDATLRDAWIGRGGPTAWPARCQVSRSHTFELFLLGQRQGLQYCCQ